MATDLHDWQLVLVSHCGLDGTELGGEVGDGVGAGVLPLHASKQAKKLPVFGHIAPTNVCNCDTVACFLTILDTFQHSTSGTMLTLKKITKTNNNALKKK